MLFLIVKCHCFLNHPLRHTVQSIKRKKPSINYGYILGKKSKLKKKLNKNHDAVFNRKGFLCTNS